MDATELIGLIFMGVIVVALVISMLPAGTLSRAKSKLTPGSSSQLSPLDEIKQLRELRKVVNAENKKKLTEIATEIFEKEDSAATTPVAPAEKTS